MMNIRKHMISYATLLLNLIKALQALENPLSSPINNHHERSHGCSLVTLYLAFGVCLVYEMSLLPLLSKRKLI